MATEKPAPKIDARVARGYQLRKEIADRQAELADIVEALAKIGAGRYEDAHGAGVTIVAAQRGGVGKPTYELRDGEDEKARQIVGESFADLFDRKVIFTVKPGFIDRADALLTPAKKRDIIALCLVPGKLISAKDAYAVWK